jgi:hypothetical protein
MTTVAELRNQLASFPDDLEILIEDRQATECSSDLRTNTLSLKIIKCGEFPISDSRYSFKDLREPRKNDDQSIPLKDYLYIDY